MIAQDLIVQFGEEGKRVGFFFSLMDQRLLFLPSCFLSLFSCFFFLKENGEKRFG